jgi:hypothetical protein
MMHIDNVTLNADGTMAITLSEFLNPIVAATFGGATVSGSVTNPNPQQVNVSITLTPGAPIAEQIVLTDPGGSASADG